MKSNHIYTSTLALMAALAFLSLSCMQISRNDSGKEKRSHFNANLLQYPELWRTATDTFGSKKDEGPGLITNGIAAVKFTIATQNSNQAFNPWVELICEIAGTLHGAKEIVISYKCDTDLLLKLSQKDFGEQGNQTWAHFQYRFKPSEVWKYETIDFSGFRQPDWTPEKAKKIPMKLENVDAIYLVPNLNPAIGQSATLQVKLLTIRQ